ncbi:bifunctional diaminohydroxyphosphoribosylaminopyrimidine deaminase/5-amino-6-(5-phosphoribosylamino)uracil reductase RibD [Flavobacteriaceae bacterium LMO-SS05]
MKIHEKYIKRCIEIAKNGLGFTRPNPMVGCVIVYQNKIIGEGFTSSYGGNHAEVNAIASVLDKSLLKASTLYVTLEPCSHFGKTPPCTNLIIEHQIPKVVIGTLDTNSKVSGKGIVALRASGSEVVVGVLEDECQAHHKRFFTFHNKQRPYIILKWAETEDGFIAPETKNAQKPVWITNDMSRQLVHKWRAEEHAILVGTNTVLEDNPSLTVRNWTGQNPIRVVLDKNNTLPKDCNVFNSEAETLIICSKTDVRRPKHWNLEFIDWNLQSAIASQICAVLHKNDIQSLIVEGGRQTLQTFIDEQLWDEARVFTGKTAFGQGIKAPQLLGNMISENNMGSDMLKIYTNQS